MKEIQPDSILSVKEFMEYLSLVNHLHGCPMTFYRIEGQPDRMAVRAKIGVGQDFVEFSTSEKDWSKKLDNLLRVETEGEDD